MNKLLEKRKLAEKVWYYKVDAPLIAKRRKAGQFIILRLWEGGERIPLTIADANEEEGTITLIVQEVGKTTQMLAELEEGEFIMDFAGPLGMPTHVEKLGTVVMVGGGIGTAPAHPIAQAMKRAGNKVITIIGARSKDLIIMEEEMRATSDEVIIVTDDGSYGEKGFVTNALQKLIDDGLTIDQVVAIGPPIMMKFVSEVTRPYKIPTVVSLNTIMVDGTGMCGGCRVLVDGKNKFVCVDGPEFDGHLVDFDNMMKRQAAYTEYERSSQEAYEKSGHTLGDTGCNLHEEIQNALAAQENE